MSKEVSREEKILKKNIYNKIGINFIKELQTLKSFNTVVSFTHIWLSILITFFAIEYVVFNWHLKSVVWIIPLSFFIATRQNALAVQIHEASHYHLFRSHKFNDYFCNIFSSYWILNDVESYRKNHLKHHRFLHSEKDPDKALYSINTKSKSKLSLLMFFLEDLSMKTSFNRIITYLKNKNEIKKNIHITSITNQVMKIIMQVIIFLYFYYTYIFEHAVILWIIFWVVPLFCIYPAIIRIRIVAEHYHENNLSGNSFVSRTTYGNIFINYLLGACMEFHFEHHLLPNIPHYNLKILHKKLKSYTYDSNLDSNKTKKSYFNTGYVNYWQKLMSNK